MIMGASAPTSGSSSRMGGESRTIPSARRRCRRCRRCCRCCRCCCRCRRPPSRIRIASLSRTRVMAPGSDRRNRFRCPWWPFASAATTSARQTDRENKANRIPKIVRPAVLLRSEGVMVKRDALIVSDTVLELDVDFDVVLVEGKNHSFFFLRFLGL